MQEKSVLLRPKKENDISCIGIFFRLFLILSICEAVIIFATHRFTKIESIFHEGLINIFLLSALSVAPIYFIILRALKQNYKANKSEKFFYKQQVEALNRAAAVSITDLDGKITFASKKFCEISGYSENELLGFDHSIMSSSHHSKEYFGEMWSKILKGEIWSGVVKNKKKDGKACWLDSTIVPIIATDGEVSEFLSIRFDVTHEKEIEEIVQEERVKNIHASRLSSLGGMASNIVHEINNPLTIIIGKSNSIFKKLNQETPDLKELSAETEKIIAVSERMTKIISGLRNFARTDNSDEIEKIPLKKVISETIDLCIERVHANEIELKVNATEQEIFCKPIHIVQVLLNLILNASDAIKAHADKIGDKWIKVDTTLVSDFVEISVCNAGPLIPKEIQEKIMQPFFTTKPADKGTGLGLSISKEIIENHGGRLFLDVDAPNTRFVIQLPLV